MKGLEVFMSHEMLALKRELDDQEERIRLTKKQKLQLTESRKVSPIIFANKGDLFFPNTDHGLSNFPVLEFRGRNNRARVAVVIILDERGTFRDIIYSPEIGWYVFRQKKGRYGLNSTSPYSLRSQLRALPIQMFQYYDKNGKSDVDTICLPLIMCKNFIPII